MIANRYEIRTKIVAPRNPVTTLRRDRLLDLLRQALLGRITVVSAPAGYGKTTLLSQFAQSLEFPVAWYTLDAGDSTIPGIMYHLVASIQQAFDTFGVRLVDRLRADEGFGRSPQEAARAMIVEFQERVPGYLVIVLDDFHTTLGSTAAREFFEELIGNQPENIHFVMASRVWPPLLSLPRLVANRVATPVGMRDLILSADEVKELLALYWGVKPEREDMERVIATTEGWPAAVALLASRPTSIQLPDWATAAASESSELFGYLAAEVYGQLRPVIQEFVLNTAVLDILTPDVCDELLGRSGSGEILRELTTLNLPVEQLGGAQPAYRYHALLQEFLRRKLRSTSRQAWADHHARAARLFTCRGQWEECIRHWSEIRRWDEVAAVIEDIAGDALLSGQWQTVAGWIDQLPRGLLMKRPALALLRARLAYLLQDADTALRLIAQVRPSIRPRNVQHLAELLALRGAALTLKGQYEEAAKSCQEAIQLIGNKTANEPIKADALKFLGMSEGMGADYVNAEADLSRALDTYEGLGDSYNAAVCHVQLSVAAAHLGKLDVAILHLETARDIWTNLGNQHQLVRVLNNLAVLYHWRGALNEAESGLKEAIRLSRQIGVKSTEGYALVSLGDLERDIGNCGRARKLYTQGLDIARSLRDGVLTLSAQLGLADVYRQSGNLEESEGLATLALTKASGLNNPQHTALCLSVLAAIQRDRGDLERSMSTSNHAAELLLGAEANREAVRTLYCVASALYALRRRSEAMNVLARVAELVGELGYDQFLVAEAAKDPSVAEYAATKGVGDGLFASIHSRLVRLHGSKREDSTRSGRLPVVSIRSFGGCSVFLNGVRISDLRWQTAKSKEMFLYILFQHGPVRKEQIVEALWADLEPAKINSCFHGTLHRLRKATYRSAILQNGGWYQVNPSGDFWFDVHEFREKTSSLRPGSKSIPDLAAANDAIKLYCGPFGPEFYSDWVQQARTLLEDCYLRSLGALLKDAQARDDFQEAITVAEKIVETNSYDCDAWVALIRGHIRGDMRGAAFRLYRRCQDVFAGELGTDLPPDVTAITAELLA